MVTLVTGMLELHHNQSQAKTDQERRIILQEIGSTDRQIESLVYGLYGLTADEIAVVEEDSAKMQHGKKISNNIFYHFLFLPKFLFYHRSPLSVRGNPFETKDPATRQIQKKSRR